MKRACHRRERTCADGALSFKMMALMTAAFAVPALTLPAADPGWWSGRGAINFSTGTNSDVVVNQGQVKQFTASAVAELNADLTTNGGAGPALSNLVYNWHQDYLTNGYETNTANPTRPYKPADFEAVNMGQLKYIASLLYGQLAAAGYTGLYPSWIVQDTNADNAAATVGQLKQVFNFDLTTLAHPVTALTATASNPGEIDLNWTASAVNNATSIIINYSTNGTTWNQLAILSDPTLTSYAETTLNAGQNYYFQIVTANSNSTTGNSSSSSSSTSATVTPALFTPILQTAYLGANNSVTLTWNESSTSGVTGYTIQQSTNNGANWNTVDTPSASQTSDTLTSSQAPGPLDTSLFQIKAQATTGSAQNTAYSAPVTPIANPATDTDSDGTPDSLDGWAGFTDTTQEAKFAPPRVPNPTYAAVVISQIPNTYTIDYVNAQGQAVVQDTASPPNYYFWDKGATSGTQLLPPTTAPANYIFSIPYDSTSTYVGRIVAITGLSDDGTVIGTLSNISGDAWSPPITAWVWTNGMAQVQPLPDPTTTFGAYWDCGDYETYPTFIKSSNGADLIYGYHTEWSGDHNTFLNDLSSPAPAPVSSVPQSYTVTWSSANYSAPPTVGGTDNETDYAAFEYWAFGVNALTDMSASPTGSSHSSYYPVQDNGSGTVIGFGATMKSYTISNSNGSGTVTGTLPVDANVTVPSGTALGEINFTNQTLATPGGGYISNGGTTNWITNGIPIAVNSAGQVLGLQNSITNNSPTANSLPGQNPALNAAPYYSDTNNVYSIPTIWVPQTNSGVVTYTPVTLTMPQTGMSFTGASIVPAGWDATSIENYFLNRPQPTMFFNTNMQIAGGIQPPVETNPPATNLCDPPYLWQNYQYHPLQTFFPGMTNYPAFQVKGISDGGTITAIATPNATTDNPSPNQEIIQLVQIDLVQQTTPTSGQYQHIDAAPIFPANNGVGLGAPPNLNNPCGVFVTLNADLTTSAAGTMTASIGGPGGYFNGTLTETAANSGVFKNSANTITLTLPVGTTTSSTAVNTLTATVNSTSLGYNNATISLMESGVESLYFYSPISYAEIIFSNAYNPSVVNSVHVNFNLEYSFSDGAISSINPISLNLAETSPGSKVFVSTTSSLTVSLTNFTGTGTGSVNNMVATFSGNSLGTSSLTETLIETSNTSMDFTSFATTGGSFSNYQGSNITPDNPSTTGDGIFYIRVKGMSGPLTLSVQTDVGAAQQVTMSPDPNNPGSLISGKLLVVPQNTNANTSSFTSVQTFYTVGNSPTLNTEAGVAISYAPVGQPSKQIMKANFKGGMFIGYRFGKNDANNLPDYLDAVVSAAQSDFNLGNVLYPDKGMKAADLVYALPIASIMYVNTHGATLPPGGTSPQNDIPFQGLAIPQEDANADIVDLEPDGTTNDPFLNNIKQSSATGGKTVYSLVFLNACSSEDWINNNSAPPPSVFFDGITYSDRSQAMFKEFNCRTYVGWSREVDIGKTDVAGRDFFNDLTGTTKVQQVIIDINSAVQNHSSPIPSSDYPVLQRDTTVLQFLGDTPPLTASQIAHDPTGNYTGN